MDTLQTTLTTWPHKVYDPDPIFSWGVQDRRLDLPNNTGIDRLAQRIEKLHSDQHDASAHWRKQENRKIGLFGERAFARLFRLPMDTRLKKFGNNRANFRLSDGTVVDVITRQMLKNGDYPDLTRRKLGTPVTAKALVLIIWLGEEHEPVLAGWQWDKFVVETGYLTEYQDGMPTYVVDHTKLLPMNELMQRHRAHDPLARPDSWTPLDPPQIRGLDYLNR